MWAADAGAAISAVSLSPDGRSLVVGGRDVLRVYSVEADGGGAVLREGRNLRIGRKKASTEGAVSTVAWHPTSLALLATGSTAGIINVVDVSRTRAGGVVAAPGTATVGGTGGGGAQWLRHARSVNRVAWHVANPAWLLSGGQDGVVKLWDLRMEVADGVPAAYHYLGGDADDAAAVPLSAACDAVYGNSSGGQPVRDVALDPFHPFAFAAALEDGSVQRWDLRRADRPHHHFLAHDGLALCLQYHPTHSGILATGGRDRLVRVWALDAARTGAFAAAIAATRAEQLAQSRSGYAWYGEPLHEFATGRPTTGASRWRRGGAALVGDIPASAGAGMRTGAAASAAPDGSSWGVRGAAGSRDGASAASARAPAAVGSSSADMERREVDLANLQTIASVAQLAWRGVPPPGASVPVAWRDDPASGSAATAASAALSAAVAPWLAAAHAPGAAAQYQVATCSALLDTSVNVWDVRTIFMPVAVFAAHGDVPTGLAWAHPRPATVVTAPAAAGEAVAAVSHGGDGSSSVAKEQSAGAEAGAAAALLISVGKDGRVAVNAPHRAVRPHAALRTAVLAVSHADIVWGSQRIDRAALWQDAAPRSPVAMPRSDAGTVRTLSFVTCDPAKLMVASAVYEAAGMREGWGDQRRRAQLLQRLQAVRAGLPPPVDAAAAPRDVAAACFAAPAHVMALCALMYAMEGAPIHVLCDHNATVAEGLGLVEAAAVWRVVAALFGSARPPAGGAAAAGEEERAMLQRAPIARRQAAARERQRLQEAAAAAQSQRVHQAAPDPPSDAAVAASAAADAAGDVTTVMDNGRPGAVAFAGGSASDRVDVPAAAPPPDGELSTAAAASPQAGGAGDSVQSDEAGSEEDSDAGSEDGDLAAPATQRAHVQLRISPLRQLVDGDGSSDDGDARSLDLDGDADLLPLLDDEITLPGFVSGLLEALTAANPAAAALALEAAGAGRVRRPEAAQHTLQPSSAMPGASTGATSGGSGGAHVSVSAALACPAGRPPYRIASQPGLRTLRELSEASWAETRRRVLVAVLEHYCERGDVQLCVTVVRVVGTEAEAAVGRERLKRWEYAYIELLHRLRLWSPASTVMARSSNERIRALNKMNVEVTVGCGTCGGEAALAATPALPGVITAAAAAAESASTARGAQASPAAPPPPPALSAATPVATPGGGGGEGGPVADDEEEGVETSLYGHAPDGTVARVAQSRGGDTITADDEVHVGALQASAARSCGSCGYDSATCAVCLQPVRGVYVWCQGCGHGGHLGHMLEWFATYGSACPAGCMHTCTLG